MHHLQYHKHHKVEHKLFEQNHDHPHQALDFLEEVHGPVVRETYISGVIRYFHWTMMMVMMTMQIMVVMMVMRMVMMTMMMSLMMFESNLTTVL